MWRWLCKRLYGLTLVLDFCCPLRMCTLTLSDTGVNPQSIRGTKTGVFIGSSFSEAAEAWTSDVEKMTGYTMTGCCRAMFANRLSYFFDLKGTFCSISLVQWRDWSWGLGGWMDGWIGSWRGWLIHSVVHIATGSSTTKRRRWRDMLILSIVHIVTAYKWIDIELTTNFNTILLHLLLLVGSEQMWIFGVWRVLIQVQPTNIIPQKCVLWWKLFDPCPLLQWIEKKLAASTCGWALGWRSVSKAVSSEKREWM